MPHNALNCGKLCNMTKDPFVLIYLSKADFLGGEPSFCAIASVLVSNIARDGGALLRIVDFCGNAGHCASTRDADPLQVSMTHPCRTQHFSGTQSKHI